MGHLLIWPFHIPKGRFTPKYKARPKGEENERIQYNASYKRNPSEFLSKSVNSLSTSDQYDKANDRRKWSDEEKPEKENLHETPVRPEWDISVQWEGDKK